MSLSSQKERVVFPVELVWKVLLELPVENLPLLPEYEWICSRPSFWKERFQREGLPLLIEGEESMRLWVEIYRGSLEAKEFVENFWERVRELRVKNEERSYLSLGKAFLGNVKEFSLLDFAQVKKEKVKRILLLAWRLQLQREKYLESLIRDSPSLTTSLEFFTRRNGTFHGELIIYDLYRDRKRDSLTFRVSREEISLFLYKTRFFGNLFIPK